TGGAQTQDGKTNVTSTPTVTGGTQTQERQESMSVSPVSGTQSEQSPVSTPSKVATALPQTGMKTAENPTKLYVAGLVVLAGVGLGTWQKVQSNNRKRKRLAKMSNDLKQSAVS
ncbi:hypothetical protein, partial [Fructobacillus tropaeoli]